MYPTRVTLRRVAGVDDDDMLRRRPVARLATTAIVAGTAAHMGAKAAQSGAAAAAPAPAESEPEGDPQIQKLQELAALRDQGVLSEEEFTAAKAKVLGI
jgi:hypothetical protein